MTGKKKARGKPGGLASDKGIGKMSLKSILHQNQLSGGTLEILQKHFDKQDMGKQEKFSCKKCEWERTITKGRPERDYYLLVIHAISHANYHPGDYRKKREEDSELVLLS